MTYLLDTCAISDFVKNIGSTIDRIKASNPAFIFVSSITVMEIEYGLAYDTLKARKIRPIISDFLETIKIINFTEKEAIKAGEIRAVLRSKGMQIGAYDVLIAATALTNNCTLVTSNIREFERVGGLSIDNWRLAPAILSPA